MYWNCKLTWELSLEVCKSRKFAVLLEGLIVDYIFQVQPSILENQKINRKPYSSIIANTWLDLAWSLNIRDQAKSNQVFAIFNLLKLKSNQAQIFDPSNQVNSSKAWYY